MYKGEIIKLKPEKHRADRGNEKNEETIANTEITLNQNEEYTIKQIYIEHKTKTKYRQKMMKKLYVQKIETK